MVNKHNFEDLDISDAGSLPLSDERVNRQSLRLESECVISIYHY